MTPIKHRLWDLKWDIRSNRRLWASRLWFLLGILITYTAVELLAGNAPVGDIEFWRILWNWLWYLVIFAFFWLVTGRRRCAGGVTASILCFVLGLVNHYVIRFRGTMFFPIDVLSWRTAANVAAGYDYTPDGAVWGALALVAVYVLVGLLAFRDKKAGRRKKRPFTIVVAGALAAFLFTFFCTGFLPAINLYAQQWNTRSNGFVFNFMLALRYSYVSEPDDYSEELVEEIQEEVHEEIVEEMEEQRQEQQEQPEQPVDPVEETEVKPNIIIIMNESFADLSIFDALETNLDPLEFIHSMEENTISGWFYSPVFGGGTANVEYEVLTCNPAAFLPSGAVAYQLYLDCETPSLASVLGEHGYTSYAFHPYLASGWNRVQAYEYLGFDVQLYDEDVADPLIVRKYISDQSDFETLISITEQEEAPVFIYNVTMQNHSGYGEEWTNLPHSIQAEVNGKAGSNELEQYLNLVNLSDEAFEDLTAYYSTCEEPTVIAMFGDHQPPLSEELYTAFLGGTNAELSSEALLEKYKTPFVIWANFDLEEQTGVTVSGSYFGPLVLEAAGVEMTEYMELVAAVRESIPVIHDLGYITAGGEFVRRRDELNEGQQELLDAYEIMAYHNQFEREGDSEFYEDPIEWDESL